VPADLDTLVIALYVMVDDLGGPRLGPGRRPRLSDAELVCLAVAQVLLGWDSERRWLRFADRRLGHLFPYLPTPSADNKRLRRAGPLVALALQDLAAHTPSWSDQLRLVDSTPVPCAASRQTVNRSALWPYAGYGYCKSHHRFFWGFRLYMLAAPDGLPVAWCLATPKLGEREVVAAMLDHERARLIIVADKGFAGRTSSSWSAAMAPGCCGLTGPMSRTGMGRWVAGVSGSRAPSTPSKTSLGWNATGDEPWPVSMPGSPSACSRWPPRSGGTGRSALSTSAPWSPMTLNEGVRDALVMWQPGAAIGKGR
jgi:hypothetical protein